ADRSLQSELNEWLLHPPEGCKLIQYEPLLTWVIEMHGPDRDQSAAPLYHGEVYQLQVCFTDRYPLESPIVTFVPPAPIHPHIYSNGHICLDILYDSSNGGWSPALTINKVALSVRSMLASNTVQLRPPGDRSYCQRMAGRSPKETQWRFDDDGV
ncbi:putative ubiquitin-conjugating enzyme E2 18, partial [Auxenochlorella protothecoides]